MDLSKTTLQNGEVMGVTKNVFRALLTTANIALETRDCKCAVHNLLE
jgi:hypothetical protein